MREKCRECDDVVGSYRGGAIRHVQGKRRMYILPSFAQLVLQLTPLNGDCFGEWMSCRVAYVRDVCSPSPFLAAHYHLLLVHVWR